MNQEDINAIDKFEQDIDDIKKEVQKFTFQLPQLADVIEKEKPKLSYKYLASRKDRNGVDTKHEKRLNTIDNIHVKSSKQNKDKPDPQYLTQQPK